MSKKFVYLFSEGNANMRELLGGKGANLAEMTNIGLPVPQGFTITTEACTQYYEDGQQINAEIQAEIMEYVAKLEEITGKKFGDLENPLLVSVRSGARASMPGMMDTILNLGLNEHVVEVLAKKSGNPRWAWDCYRRFIQMYSDVVMEVGKKYFEELIDKMKESAASPRTWSSPPTTSRSWPSQFKAEYKAKIGADFPTDPVEQLMGAIKAVFRSWDNPRANVYRRDNDIPYSWGTAVNVQSMAFGNMGDDCGTGVAFTRNPATGEKKLFGEFLTNAQGEDVVAGVRTPMPISEMAEKFPEAFAQFEKVCKTLEDHYRDMQDMEFTVEHGKLYMLQTRNGKRTAAAALKIACDLVDEGMIDEKQAVAMIEPRTLDTLLHPQFDAEALKKATRHGPRPGRLSRRRLRQDRLHRRGRQGLGRPGREGGPGPAGDLSRGHRGHEGRPGHPDRPRRHDLSRRRRGPRHGHLLRVRLRRHRHGRGEQAVHPGRQDLPRGRLALHRRLHRQDLRRRHPHGGRHHRRRVRPRHGLGGQVPPPEGPHQRRHPPRRQAGPRASAPRASACAAPSTCSSTPTASPPSAR